MGDRGVGCLCSSALPLWIPAFAGMTGGLRDDGRLARPRPGHPPAVASLPRPPSLCERGRAGHRPAPTIAYVACLAFREGVDGFETRPYAGGGYALQDLVKEQLRPILSGVVEDVVGGVYFY